MTAAEIVGLHQEQHRREQPEGVLCLIYIVSGEGILRAQQREVVVQEDDLVIINPDLGFELRAGLQPMEYGLIRMEEASFDFSHAEVDFAVLHCNEYREQIRFYLRELLHEQREKLPCWEIALENLLSLMVIITIRRGEITLLSETNRSGKECSAVKRYIDANFAEDITLDVLADRTGLNKYYLVHAFTKNYGISPINYLIRQRIVGSQQLLRETDYNIAKIAQLSGFSSQSYFSQSFKRQTGKTPAQFRKECQSKTGEL